jgi:hypothetical protein
MDTSHGHDPHPHGPINHETTDIHLDGIAKITIGFAIFMVLVVGAMYGVFQFFGGAEAVEARPPSQSAPNAMEQGYRMPAGPKLLTNEPMNLRQYRADQTSRLHSYGWVDRAGNIVHLPIDRAIALTVERGLPAAPVVEPPVDAPVDPAAVPQGEAAAVP